MQLGVQKGIVISDLSIYPDIEISGDLDIINGRKLSGIIGSHRSNRVYRSNRNRNNGSLLYCIIS